MSSRSRVKGREGRHVRLYHYMMRTAAWKSLDAVARCIYIDMASNYAGTGTNNGRIPYSVREAAAELRIGKSTAHEAMRNLQERGFIVAVTQGAFSLKKRHATEWRLTEFASDVDTSFATKEFMRWEQIKPAEIQNTVPVGGPLVPVGGPFGTSRRTVHTKQPSYGSPTGTVESKETPSRSACRYTTSLPGGCRQSETLSVKAGERSAPPRCAVASSPAFSDDVKENSGVFHTRKIGRPLSQLHIRTTQILAASDVPLSITQIAERAGADPRDLTPLLGTMLKAGKVVRPKRAHYARAA
jgi:hypothetical protein